MYLWRPGCGLISCHRASNDIEKIKKHVMDLCEELDVELINGEWMYDNLDADVIVVKSKNKYNEERFLGNICMIKDIK